MNYFLFILNTAFADFSRNKGRTILTSLGILIGVLAVVLLISFGLGLRKYIQGQFESLGTNLLIVYPGKLLSGGSFRSSSGGVGTIRFDEKDVISLKKTKFSDYVVPVFTKTVTMSVPGVDEVTDIYATSADIFAIRNLEVEFGKKFERSDLEKRSKVVVIGPKLSEKLFGASNAVGRTVKIDGQGYKVLGVLKSKGGGGFGGPDFDSFTYMPYKTAYSFNPEKKFIAIYLKARNESVVPDLKTDISNVLLKRYKEDDFSVIEQTEILNAISSIFSVLNLVLIAIAAISLVVGGIGIMNIMYVTVTERIKEIGIRRAIGARKADILLLFLVESVLLSLFGGLLGLALAFVIVLLIQSIFPAYIDITSVVLALGVSSTIGIVFGVFPAKKAADLSPIDAIRYE